MVEQIVQNDNIKIEDAGSQIKDSEDNNHVVENFNIKVGCDVETQTDLDINELTLLFEKLTLYGNVMKVYETKLKKFDLSQESFKNDNAKTKYFSGLENYEVLSYLHEVACPFLFTRSNTKLNTFQQLIVTLMILRLNLPYRYFSYRYVILYNDVLLMFEGVWVLICFSNLDLVCLHSQFRPILEDVCMFFTNF